MVKRDDIIWLAGLLEGEAWFGLREGKYPIIALKMCDEDVVVKVASLIKSRVKHYGNIYDTQACGARAIEWMMTLHPLLYARRRKMVASIIKFWKENNYGRAPNGMRSMATCHPDRLNGGLGLCKPCYNRQWYEKKKLLKRVE